MRGPRFSAAGLTLGVTTLVGAWLGMQAVHELGHVVACWMTGGQVIRVVLSPWTISRTDFVDSCAPLLVVAGGPLLGAGLPLLLAWLLRASSVGFVLRFFAGFCLIANGCYVAFGSLEGIGDSGELLRLGAPRWTLWLFGLITAPAGLWLWHGQARHFGLGRDAREVSRRAAATAAAAAILLLAIALLVGGA